MNLTIVSCAVVGHKIVNKMAKGRQFENILNVEYTYHFLLSSHKSMFIKKYYMLLPISLKMLDKKPASLYMWRCISIPVQLLILCYISFYLFLNHLLRYNLHKIKFTSFECWMSFGKCIFSCNLCHNQDRQICVYTVPGSCDHHEYIQNSLIMLKRSHVFSLWSDPLHPNLWQLCSVLCPYNSAFSRWHIMESHSMESSEAAFFHCTVFETSVSYAWQQLSVIPSYGCNSLFISPLKGIWLLSRFW